MSFLNLAPGDNASTIFKAPHAPCDEAADYVFFIGAYTRFEPPGDCAAHRWDRASSRKGQDKLGSNVTLLVMLMR